MKSGIRPAKTNPKSTEKRSKKKQPQKQQQKHLEDDAESEKQKKLRYYIVKLLQMKHEEVENLSSASTNDSRKQVNKVYFLPHLILFSLLLIIGIALLRCGSTSQVGCKMVTQSCTANNLLAQLFIHKLSKIFLQLFIHKICRKGKGRTQHFIVSHPPGLFTHKR